MRPAPRFGVMLPAFDWGVAQGVALAAEAQGYDSLWVPDHMLNPMLLGGETRWETLEAWTLMSVLAGATQRVQLGFMMLNPAFRPAALLAKMAATLDRCSGGRLVFSIGAGYFEEEYRQYDLTFDTDPADRLGRAREVALLARELWASPHEQVDFAGKYVQARGCYLGVDCVQRPHPPVWFGGDSPASRAVMDEVAGEGAAGGWFMHAQLLDENLAWFHAESRHRDDPDFTLATYVFAHIAETTGAAIERARTFVPVHPRYERDFDDTIRHNAFGTVDEVEKKLRGLLERGLGHIVLVTDPMTQAVLATDVLPALREE